MGTRRSFKGHKFVKLITNNWVLDTTEGIGYHVLLDRNGRVIRHDIAFRLHINRQTGAISFKKNGNVPVKILLEAMTVANNYISLCSDNTQ